MVYINKITTTSHQAKKKLSPWELHLLVDFFLKINFSRSFLTVSDTNTWNKWEPLAQKGPGKPLQEAPQRWERDLLGAVQIHQYWSNFHTRAIFQKQSRCCRWKGGTNSHFSMETTWSVEKARQKSPASIPASHCSMNKSRKPSSQPLKRVSKLPGKYPRHETLGAATIGPE